MPGRGRFLRSSRPFFRLALPSVAASPPGSHRGLLAIVHPSDKGCPLWNPVVPCHDSGVRGRGGTVASARAAALALGAVGAGFGLLTLAEAWSAPGGSFGGTSWVGAVAELAAGWALITAGGVESWRRPASRAGLLLAGAGIGWFFTEWNNPGFGSPAAFTF